VDYSLDFALFSEHAKRRLIEFDITAFHGYCQDRIVIVKQLHF
jgi:hypothetical protein